MPPTLISRKKVYENFFLVEELVCQAHNSEGQFKRFVLARPDSAAVLLHNKELDEIIFVKQFRAPAIDKNDPQLLELPAGIVEEAETPEECITRESFEEAGYHPSRLTHINSFYPSPGISSERIHVYYGEVADSDKQGPGGGMPEEHEDLELVSVSKEEAKAMIKDGRIMDAKTIIALQWLQ